MRTSITTNRVTDRIASIPRWLLLSTIGVGVGAVATLPPLLGIGLLGATLAIASIFWLEAGYTAYIIGLYFILFIKRMTLNLPVGLALDGFVFLLLVGVMLRLSRTQDVEARLRWKHPMVAFVLVYEGYQIVNAFNPSSLSWVFSTYAVRQTLPNLVVFLMTILVICDRRKLQFFLLLWYGLATAVALYAIKQQIFGFYWRELLWMNSPDGQTWTTGEGIIRVFSFMLPDTTGMTMAFALTLSVALLFSPIKFIYKVGLVGLMPVFGAAMLFTGTRGAYAAALIGVAVVVLLLKRWWLYLAAPVGIAAVLSLVDFSSSYWGTRFLTVFNPDQDASYQVRQNIIGQYLSEALNKPFGNGTTTTSYASFAQDQLKDAQSSNAFLASGVNIPTDNNYFLVLVEQGVVGEIILLIVLGCVLFYAVRLAFIIKDAWLRSVGIGLAGCCVAAAISSIANNYLSFWGTWILIALVCVVDQLGRAANAAGLPDGATDGSGGSGSGESLILTTAPDGYRDAAGRNGRVVKRKPVTLANNARNN